MNKVQRLLIYIFVFLVTAEMMLEFREYVRGYRSLVFGLLNENRGHKGPHSTSQSTENMKWGDTNDPIFPFRSRLVEESKGTNVQRIWVLSSSMTEDIYLPPSDIWPNILDSILSRGKPGHYEILNAAKVGMDIIDGLKKVEAFYPRFKPDILIIYEMSNTINKNIKKFLWEGEDNQTPIANNKEHWVDSFIENTVLYGKAKSFISTRLIKRKILKDSLGYDGFNFFVSNFNSIRDFCDKSKIKLIICTFATQVGPDDDYDSVDKSASFCFRYNGYLSTRGWVNTIKLLNGEIKYFAEKENIDIIDLDTFLTGRKDLFRDYVHFTKKGHSEVAGIIASYLLKP